ncbi:hypothetical protein D8B20_14630 [Candidatus Pantoea soli]|uniref:Uncharacterized protein n=1 Tax=Candidatus Pantoea soli TaxID=3098669 RepID=A0A518XG15_9GAMM|nr:hypothetical protein D8B20_14630 [Pantoea soli]
MSLFAEYQSDASPQAGRHRSPRAISAASQLTGTLTRTADNLALRQSGGNGFVNSNENHYHFAGFLCYDR